jgi:hypothetical protein
VVIIKPERGWSILPCLSLFVIQAVREMGGGLPRNRVGRVTLKDMLEAE